MTLWDEICRQVEILKQRNAPESDMQTLFENIFVELGWSRLQGELLPQWEIPIGAANRLILDIIIKSNGENLFVVEVKRPTNEVMDKYIRQLQSYMLQLKLAYGIYVGKNIRIFYDDQDNRDQPQEITTVEFNVGNRDGQELFELLKKENYSNEEMRKYCVKKITERKDREQASAIASELINGISKIKLDNLLEEALTNEYSVSIAHFVLEEISIKLSRKTQNPPPPLSPQPSSGGGAMESSPSDPPKIGRRAEEAFGRLLAEGKLSDDEIFRLCDPSYSRRTFGPGAIYPILREIPPGVDPDKLRKDHNGRNRYWKKIHYANDRKYIISSQWYKHQRPQLEDYLSQKGV